jgi:kumamolisin
MSEMRVISRSSKQCRDNFRQILSTLQTSPRHGQIVGCEAIERLAFARGLMLSRRALLSAVASSVATTFAGSQIAPRAGAETSGALPTVLRLERRSIEVYGKPASVFRISQPDGSWGIRTQSGVQFRVRVENRINEPSLIHWHASNFRASIAAPSAVEVFNERILPRLAGSVTSSTSHADRLERYAACRCSPLTGDSNMARNSSTRHPLQGSERQPLPGARTVGKADPTERLEVSVLLRRHNGAALTERVKKLAKREEVGGHLSREQFDQQFSADAADVAAVRRFAEAHGLAVVQEHAGRRTVVLSGTVAQFNAAFGVDLQRFEYEGGSYRGRVGAVQLPDELRGLVEAVLGLDDRPAAKPHFRGRPSPGNVRWRAGGTGATSFTPLQIASLYGFPSGTGQGECVAIIELGGGERTADLTAYFSGLGIKTAPNVTAVSVDHGKNHPTGDPNGPDGEVMLDIEVVGAIAPSANIAVYFAPNTDAGFLDAITTAIHDTTTKPSIISISWGGPESSWTQQAMTAFDSAFQAAAAMGITVCVASGDNGSSDGVADGSNHVDFPASSPNVLACGGTNLRASGTTISESVWNDGQQGGAGGGGMSSFFTLPAWQDGLKLTLTSGGTQALSMRGVPDVSGDADPETGYDVRIDGTDTVIGGTSAVAPLWAGLIARINSSRGSPIGFMNPQLYAATSDLNDVTTGNNGTYAAGPGWDACTGLGSPDGTKIAALFGHTTGPSQSAAA